MGMWQSVLRRVLLFAVTWWVLVEGEVRSWWFGVPVVLVAATASLVLVSPTTLVWFELARFVPYFLVRSFAGGVDVAWRALHPGMPIEPHMIEYPTRLRPGLPLVFLANTVSLLPGTLSVVLNTGYLNVHVLSGRRELQSELESLEERVAALFGITLPAPGRGVS